MAIALGAAFIPYSINHRFYYNDDQQNCCYPYMIDIGRHLCNGELPWLTLSTFYGGNLILDWQYGLFNPFTLLVCWHAAHVTDLTQFGLAVNFFFFCWLSTGTYLLARAFEIRRIFAVVVSTVISTNNFISYIAADSWITVFSSFTWFIWTWVFLQRYRTTGRSSFLALTTVFGLVTFSAGFPQTTLMLGLLIFAYSLDFFTEKLYLTGILLLTIATSWIFICAPMLLPALLTFNWTNRDTSFVNGGFFTTNLADILNSSSFLHMPWIQTWHSPTLTMPITHLAWFVLPLLALVDFSRAYDLLRSYKGLLLFLVFAVIFLFGPEHLGPIRYPFRFIPFVYTTLILIFFIVISQRGIFILSKDRQSIAFILIFLSFIASASGHPEFTGLHALSACLLTSLTYIAIFLIKYHRPRLLAACMASGLLVGYYFTHRLFPFNTIFGDFGADTKVTQASTPPLFRGYSFFVGNRYNVDSLQNQISPYYGADFSLAAQGINKGLNTINGYSSIGHILFNNVFKIDLYTAITAKEGVDCLFQVEPETMAPFIDLMRINSLSVYSRDTAGTNQSFYLDEVKSHLDKGWSESGKGYYTTHFTRNSPNTQATTLSWSSPGTSITLTQPPQGMIESFRVKSGESGGFLVFARLWWPGYEANLDGSPLKTEPLDNLLVKVELPAHSNGLLTLRYVPAGIHLSYLLCLIGTVLCGVLLPANRSLYTRTHSPAARI